MSAQGQQGEPGSAANNTALAGAQHEADVLEAQTSRGLIVVSALLKLSARMVAPELGAEVSPAGATQLAAMHAELKAHTNDVLDAIWHIRNLSRRQQHQA